MPPGGVGDINGDGRVDTCGSGGNNRRPSRAAIDVDLHPVLVDGEDRRVPAARFSNDINGDAQRRRSASVMAGAWRSNRRRIRREHHLERHMIGQLLSQRRRAVWRTLAVGDVDATASDIITGSALVTSRQHCSIHGDRS
jgi:hypothetical protein